jgi:hypothetical protein
MGISGWTQSTKKGKLVFVFKRPLNEPKPKGKSIYDNL